MTRALDLGARRMRHRQPEGGIVVDRLPRQQAEMLEHHGDAVGRAARDRLALHEQLAAAQIGEAGDAAQQRGLAAARRADHAHDLVALAPRATTGGRRPPRRRGRACSHLPRRSPADSRFGWRHVSFPIDAALAAAVRSPRASTGGFVVMSCRRQFPRKACETQCGMPILAELSRTGLDRGNPATD